MNMDQQLGNLALGLETLLCSGLGLAPPPAVTRNLKLKAIKDGLGQRMEEAAVSQALTYFSQHAPNRVEFEHRAKRAQLKNLRGHQELLALLHTIATDPALAVLTKGPLDFGDTAKPSALAAAKAAKAAASAGAAGRQTGSTAGIQHAQLQPSTAAAAQTASNAATGRVSAGGQAVGGYSTPLASMPAVSTPYGASMGGGAIPSQPSSAAGLGSAGIGSQGGARQPAPAVPVQGVPESPRNVTSNPASGVRAAASAGGAGAPYNNPVFGQEDANSPAVRIKDYTPTLAQSLSAQRKRPTTNPSEPNPNLPSAGDLFALKAPQHAAAVAAVGLLATPAPKGAPGSLSAPQGGGGSGPSSLDIYRALPSWDAERPHLTCLDLVRSALPGGGSMGGQVPAQAAGSKAKAGSGAEQLGSLTPDMQEVAVLNDLLYAFLGLDGKYVRARLVPAPSTAPPGTGPALAFVLAPGCEPCLAELVQRVLPICEYVAILQRFVETRSSYSFGLVAHGVAAAMRAMLADWSLVVSQLEHQLRLGRLTAQGLVFYCQGPLASLGLLASIAAEAAAARLTSSGLLNLLHAKAASLAGDQAGRALVHRLLHAAAAPYFRMLERWQLEGVLDDPHGEFMVQEDKSVGKEALTDDHRLAYWHSRYTLRKASAESTHSNPGSPATTAGLGPRHPSVLLGGSGSNAGSPDHLRGGGSAAAAEALQLDVPVFLRGVADTILTTGKYLNAIRECGRAMPPPLASSHKIAYDPSHTYITSIHAAHARASAALLRVLVEEAGLMGWLRSIKHFFLLDQGDLVVHMCEAAREELDRPASDISRPRLQSLLELGVRTSSVGQDPHADNLVADLDPRSLAELARAAGAIGPASTAPHSLVGTPAGTPAASRRPPQAGAAAASTGASAAAAAASAAAAQQGEVRSGWEVLLLSYRLTWPMTLVVPPRALATYQLIFRHLFGLKHAERKLAVVWHRMQRARNASRPARDALKPAFALVQRHLFLVQELARYASTDVLEPAWRAMEDGMRKAVDADQVIRCHAECLARAVDGLLLSRPRLLRPLLALQASALSFCARVEAAWDTLDAQQEAAAAAAATAQRTASGRGTAGAVGVRPSQPGASGAQRVPARGGSIAERREAAYAGLSVSQPQQAAAASQPAAGTAHLDLTGLEDEFRGRLSEVVAGLQDMYDAAMRGVAVATAASAGLQEPLEAQREELEALQGLIERLSTGGGMLSAAVTAAAPAAGAAGAARPGAGGFKSTREMHAALAAQAAAMDRGV